MDSLHQSVAAPELPPVVRSPSDSVYPGSLNASASTLAPSTAMFPAPTPASPSLLPSPSTIDIRSANTNYAQSTTDPNRTLSVSTNSSFGPATSYTSNGRALMPADPQYGMPAPYAAPRPNLHPIYPMPATDSTQRSCSVGTPEAGHAPWRILASPAADIDSTSTDARQCQSGSMDMSSLPTSTHSNQPLFTREAGHPLPSHSPHRTMNVRTAGPSLPASAVNGHSFVAPSMSTRGRAGSVTRQPLKTTYHNSTPSIEMAPSSYAQVPACQKDPVQHKNQTDNPISVAGLPKKKIAIRFPSEVVHRSNATARHAFLPPHLQHEVAALEAEVGDELDNDLSNESTSTYGFEDEFDQDGVSDDPPSSSELDLNSSSSSARPETLTISAVEREEKKVRLLALRTIDERRAMWRPRVPGTELIAQAVVNGDQTSFASAGYDVGLQLVTRMPHEDERDPNVLPDALAIAMPLPPYRAWNGYLQWRHEELARLSVIQGQMDQASFQAQPQTSPTTKTNYEQSASDSNVTTWPRDRWETIDIEAKAADIDIGYTHRSSIKDEQGQGSNEDSTLGGGDSYAGPSDGILLTSEDGPHKLNLSPHSFSHSPLPLPLPQLPDLNLGLNLGFKDDSSESNDDKASLKDSPAEANVSTGPIAPLARGPFPWALPLRSQHRAQESLPNINVLDECRPVPSSPRPGRLVRNRQKPQYSLDLSSSGGPFGKEIFAALGLPALSDTGSDDVNRHHNGPPHSSAPTPTLDPVYSPPPVREIKSDSAAPQPKFDQSSPPSVDSLELQAESLGSSPASPSTKDALPQPYSNMWRTSDQEATNTPLVDSVPLGRDSASEDLRTNPSEDADASDPETSPYRPPHRLAGVPRLSAFGSLPLNTTLSPVLPPTVLEEFSDGRSLSSSQALHSVQEADDESLEDLSIHTQKQPIPRPAARQHTRTSETLPSSSIGEGEQVLHGSPMEKRTFKFPRSYDSDTPSNHHLANVDSSLNDRTIHHPPREADMISNPSDEEDDYGTFGEEEDQTNANAEAFYQQPRSYHAHDLVLASLRLGRGSRRPHVAVDSLLQSPMLPSMSLTGHDRIGSDYKGGRPDGVPAVAKPSPSGLNAAAPEFQPNFGSKRSTLLQRAEQRKHSVDSPSLPEVTPPPAKPISIGPRPRGNHQVKMSVADVLASMEDEDIVPGRPSQNEVRPGMPTLSSKLEYLQVLTDDHEPEGELSDGNESVRSDIEVSIGMESGVPSPKSMLDLSDRGMSIALSSSSPATLQMAKHALAPPEPNLLSIGKRAWTANASNAGSESSIETDHDVHDTDSSGSVDELDEDVVDELARHLESRVDVWMDKLVREMHSAMSLAPAHIRNSSSDVPRFAELSSDQFHGLNFDQSGKRGVLATTPQGQSEFNEHGEVEFERVQSILTRALDAFKTSLDMAIPDIARPLLDQQKDHTAPLTPKLTEDCIARLAATIGFRLRNSLTKGIEQVQSGLMAPAPQGLSLGLSIERLERATDSLDTFTLLQKGVEDVSQYVSTRMDRMLRNIQQGRDSFVDELETAVVKGLSPQLDSLRQDGLDPDLISALLVTRVHQIIDEQSMYDEGAEHTADLINDLIRPMLSALIQDFLGDVRDQTEIVLGDWLNHANQRLETAYARQLKPTQSTWSDTSESSKFIYLGRTKVVDQGLPKPEIEAMLMNVVKELKSDLGPATALLEPLGFKQDRTNSALLQFLESQGSAGSDLQAIPATVWSMVQQLSMAVNESKDGYKSILDKMGSLAAVDQVSDLGKDKLAINAKVEALQHELKELDVTCQDAVAQFNAQKMYVETLEKDLSSTRARLGQAEHALEESKSDSATQHGMVLQARQAENDARRELDKARMAQASADGRTQKLADAHQDAQRRIKDGLAEINLLRSQLGEEQEAHATKARNQQYRLDVAEASVTEGRKKVDHLTKQLLDVQSSTDARIQELSALAGRAAGEQVELRKRLTEQDAKLVDLTEQMATTKDLLSRKDTQLADLCRRAADSDKTARMLRMAEATIVTMKERLATAEQIKSQLTATQETEQTLRTELEEHRTKFDTVEKEVQQLKDTLVERSQLEEAQSRAEATQNENDELRRQVAVLQAHRADSHSLAPLPSHPPNKTVRFVSEPTPIPSHRILPQSPPSPVISAMNAPPSPFVSATYAAINQFIPAARPPVLKKAPQPVQVDEDGWWG